MPIGTLSMILLNYNHGSYLGESLKAILNQSFRPKEVIVVDDGSTDNSVSIVEQFAKENPIIHLLRNGRNLGIIESMNRTVKIASGDFIAILGSDDPLRPGFLEKAMNLLTRYPQSGLCCANHTLLVEDGKRLNGGVILSDGPRYFSSREFADLFRKRWELAISTAPAIWKRSAWLNTGGAIAGLKWHCDWFTAMVVGFRHGICYISESFETIRANPRSYSTGENSADQWCVLENLLRVLESPQYDDVRDDFRIPAVLSRFGLKILNLMVKNPRYWHYLSLPLIEHAGQWVIHHEGFQLGIKINMPKTERTEDIVNTCYQVLQTFAEEIKKAGDASQREGMLDEAIRFYLKALEANPDFAEANANLGDIFYQKGQFELASTYYRKSLALKPHLMPAFRNLENILNYQDATASNHGKAPTDDGPGLHDFPTLSVILPNYSHVPYLKDALESVFSQSYKPFEAVVIDDGSEHRSMEIITRDPALETLYNKQAIEVVPSFTRGLARAKGDYICFLSPEDKVRPDFFEKSIRLLKLYPQAGLCSLDPASFSHLTDTAKQDRWASNPRYFSPQELPRFIRSGYTIQPTSILKRSALLEAGGYIPELKWYSDWFMRLVIAFRHGACYIPEPLGTTRVRSRSFVSPSERDGSEQRQVLNHLLRLLKSPAYRDVLPLFVSGSTMSHFGKQIAQVVLSDPEHWDIQSLMLILEPLSKCKSEGEGPMTIAV